MSDRLFEEAVQQMRALAAAGGGMRPPIEPPRPRDDDDGMEARVKRLEDDVRAIRSDLMTINGRLANVEGKLETLSTQVISKVPSGFQMFAIIAGTITLTVVVLGAAAKMAQWLKVIPG